ncbi:MAG: twin-arginine translocase TatA/TatE family subunit [Planctomycetota bacterium]|nr:twin-arginine translocase TatA/TatE family subunit [Planctomycetota bacterium]
MIPAFQTLAPVLALPGIGELWPILVIVVLLFGARKLPELAGSMGKSITSFRKGLKEAQDEVEDTKTLVDKDESGGSAKD